MELLNDAEFWVSIAFLILIALVYKPIKRSLAAGLDGRAAKIKSELDEARRLREEAQALLAEYQSKQRAALADAEKIVRHAGDEAERNRLQAQADLAASLKRREQQAVDRIAQAEAKALDEVRALAVEIAVGATRALLKSNLDATRASALVDQAIAELPQRLH
ncbi:MAG TPA: F0F1 ATP synthase subunit B [Alphaproteobacteria bacterium]|nr:F0F1 ATP synthase subunit B [Alphaproteobacteria bacterium]